MEEETKNCVTCKRIQKGLSDKLKILPQGINENIFKFIPCKKCFRIHTAIKNEAEHMEYHSGGPSISRSKLCQTSKLDVLVLTKS